MNIMDLANKLKKVEDMKSPPVSDKIEPIQERSRASALLAELEEKHGFDRSMPSMEYKGSERNADYVRNKIRLKYGDIEADNYVPGVQVMPKTEWLKHGFVPKDNEEPLCYIVSKRSGRTINVALWHLFQMEKA